MNRSLRNRICHLIVVLINEIQCLVFSKQNHVTERGRLFKFKNEIEEKLNHSTLREISQLQFQNLSHVKQIDRVY